MNFDSGLMDQVQERTSARASRKAVSGVVTDRDLRALTWVIQQGAMTGSQIFRAVYQSTNPKSQRYAYRRIQFLESAGYLCPVPAPHSRERFLKGTRSALSLLELKGTPNLPRSLHVPTTSEIPHSEVLTNLRLQIRDSGRHGEGVWWKPACSLIDDPEFPAFRFRELMPDALWTTRRGKRVAIEFERTRKGITRIRQKVEALDQELLRSDRAFDLVLWIAVDGAYRDLRAALSNRETQTLRTVPEFMAELAKSE